MKPLFLKLSLLFLLAITISSCQFNIGGNGVNAEGEIVEKEFKIDKTFDKVSTGSAWDVELIKSDETRLMVRTNENIIPLFEYKINGGELSISSKGNIRNPDVMDVELYYKSLSEIHASSASDVTSKEVFEQRDITISSSSAADIILRLKTKNCNVSASSASDIELSGTSINFNANASSSADIDAENLKTKNSTVKASSAASIDVYATESLTAKTSSSGSIDYSGNPKTTDFDQSTSGGDIEKND
jgi:hypothetical protein